MKISILTRFHDLSKLHQLKEACFSISLLREAQLEHLIITQNLGEDGAEEIRTAIAPYGKRVAQKVVDLQVRPGDHRSHLLNQAVAMAEGEYLLVLDYDDVLYPDGPEKLRDVLDGRPEHMMAIGNIVMAETTYFNDQAYIVRKWRRPPNKTLADLCVDNFAPIHSYMWRASATRDGALAFDEDLPLLEDYDFLLRFIDQHKVTTDLSILVGEYRLRSDHTIRSYGRRGDPLQQSTYERVLQFLAEKKDRLKLTLPQSAFAPLQAAWSGTAAPVPVTRELAEARAQLASAHQSQGAGRMLVSALMRDAESHPPVWPLGRVDAIERAPIGGFYAQGWVAQPEGEPFAHPILVVMESGAVHSGHVSFNRPDVAASGHNMLAGWRIHLDSNEVRMVVVDTLEGVHRLRGLPGRETVDESRMPAAAVRQTVPA